MKGWRLTDAVKEVITANNFVRRFIYEVERYLQLLLAANVSVTSAKQIGEALKYVGGGAKEHWSIEETLGAIATLSQKGVEGSTAGISIRSFMVYILREMPKSQKALSQIGMTFDDFWEKVNGKRVRLKPFQDIIKMMSEAMYSKGMGRGDMMKVLAQFGEPRMMQQYIKLFPSQEELQSGTWLLAQFNSEMQKTYDMQSRLQNVLNSTQEKWNQMMSGIQVAEISIARERFLL
jgi:TP901 family phage tail tape measure protein